MLKANSIYMVKVAGCAPAAFRGEQLSKKDEKGRCYGGWLPLKMGSLGVDAYVYLVFNEDGSLSSDRSFAYLLEKLPSKEAIGTKTVFEVNELLTASPLLLEHYMNNYSSDQRVADANDLRMLLSGEVEPKEDFAPDWRDTAARALARLDGECYSEALLNLYLQLYR